MESQYPAQGRGGGGRAISGRHVHQQGRVHYLHFTCHATLPMGTTLRVTSSALNPLPPSCTGGGGGSNSNLILPDEQQESGEMKEDASSSACDANSTKLVDNYLNTVEMYTTPEMYPIWKTTHPVAIIDDGSSISNLGGEDSEETADATDTDEQMIDVNGGDSSTSSSTSSQYRHPHPLIHRYRYVAVTPGATIDWSLCTRKGGGGEFANTISSNDDASRGSSTTGGNITVATTPPLDDYDHDGQEERNEDNEDEDVGEVDGRLLRVEEVEEDDEEEDDGVGAEFEFPPVLYEDPTTATKDEPMKKSAGGKSVSSASVMTWDGVSSLPYRARVVGGGFDGAAAASSGEEIIDHWNCATDITFQTYWEEITNKRQNDAMLSRASTTSMVSSKEDMDTDDNEEEVGQEQQSNKESIFIVCYHLPVIVSRDPHTSKWNACWSESLIAKSELFGVSSTRKTTWIGTVSNVPSSQLENPVDREEIRQLLQGMGCIPIFFSKEEQVVAIVEASAGASSAGAGGAAGGEKTNTLLDRMYLGFCKQVLWPSFHNVDLLDLATNGWGQCQRNTIRSDPVVACAHAAAEAKERKRSESSDGMMSNITTTQSPSTQKPQKLQSNWDQRRLDSWWNAYVQVNQTFSDVVADLVSGGDIVWVHDYHLALLPRMLREARNEKNVVVSTTTVENSITPIQFEDVDNNKHATVGGHHSKPVHMIFFIHVPFPTSQVFRELEHGEALLEGMLHADVVGFHAFDHARHFLNAAKRILGSTYESLVGGLIGIRHRGTKVVVTVSNVSIEADVIDALLEYPSVKEEAKAIQQKHSGRTIISGIAVAERLSGVTYKLLAFERLLADYPIWQSKVVLLQRCLISGARRVDEADTLSEVRSLVQRIRQRFGPEVIDYEEQVGSVYPIDRRLAIWTSSHVMMHTHVREGLNLCPLEYVYARKEPADPGVVIASEFSAVSSILNGALRVNPYDVQMCVTSIDCALSMSFNERDARRGRDIDFVSSCPSGLWTRNVLRDLNDATLQSTKMEAIGDCSPDSILAREAELGLVRLDLKALRHAYANTKSRVIIIDFNGTLVVKEPAGKYLKREILGTSGFKPSPITTLALRKLCSDPRNTVYVVSGDSQQNLELAVGGIPGLGLAASNGTCFADPGREHTWQYLDFGVDWTAVKKVAVPIISKFTARTNGSFVKLSHSSIGWSYYSCDPEWGSLQASYLVAELGEALQSFDVRFEALKGIVEVVPRKGHKGHIVKKILQDSQARNKVVDFVLCMGDDISDEKMFTSVINFAASSENENSYAFNVAVGKKPTNASFYVDDASDVREVLVALSGDRSLRQRQASSTGLVPIQDFFA
ncbi:hypothetical protein ACHAXH_008584 [Discostella pseudostelligera]